MIWLTWRQFRVQALVAVGALAVVGGFLAYLGAGIRDDWTAVLGCAPSDCPAARHDFDESYSGPLTVAGLLLIAVAALIGIFWGAPLVARELEERTDRLVWYQSVTRTRWLATKLVVLALVSAAVTGTLSLMLTWNASRYDELAGDRFGALSFASRNVVPLGYAVFAFVLGTVVGLFLRRTLAAMAVTLAVFAAVQLLVPTVLREHLMTPVTTTVAFDEQTPSRADLFTINDKGAKIIGYVMPGTWALSGESAVFNADGTSYTEQQRAECDDQGSQSDAAACMAGQSLHFSYTYQPADRYWPFQWIELTGYLGLSVLLAAAGFWRIRRRSR